LVSPKVSVIIPVYNVEAYLRECLDSILAQDLSDIEIICVNDGSIDNSLSILQHYASQDERIIIISQENSGAASARNNGLKKARGEYIFIPDSDDYLLSTNALSFIHYR
jgi:glycosyltransferase involved in cell wall biosynthesis